MSCAAESPQGRGMLRSDWENPESQAQHSTLEQVQLVLPRLGSIVGSLRRWVGLGLAADLAPHSPQLWLDTPQAGDGPAHRGLGTGQALPTTLCPCKSERASERRPPLAELRHPLHSGIQRES